MQRVFKSTKRNAKREGNRAALRNVFVSPEASRDSPRAAKRTRGETSD
jgi:hypothetical protein